MKNECQIVRDLMPLCIDHAASEESQTLVDEHIRTCESCAEIYGEMTRALPKLQSMRDSRDLARTVRQMRRRKALRAAAIVILVFIVGLLAALPLKEASQYLYNRYLSRSIEPYVTPQPANAGDVKVIYSYAVYPNEEDTTVYFALTSPTPAAESYPTSEPTELIPEE